MGTWTKTCSPVHWWFNFDAYPPVRQNKPNYSFWDQSPACNTSGSSKITRTLDLADECLNAGLAANGGGAIFPSTAPSDCAERSMQKANLIKAQQGGLLHAARCRPPSDTPQRATSRSYSHLPVTCHRILDPTPGIKHATGIGGQTEKHIDRRNAHFAVSRSLVLKGAIGHLGSGS